MFRRRDKRPTFAQTRGARVLLALTVTVGLARTQQAAGQSAVVDTTLWVPNDVVGAVVRSGDTIYLAGAFKRIGRATGSFARLDAGTGQLIEPFPRVAGFVEAAAPDGSGGWFIGGDFDWVGGIPRKNVAHIRSDGSVDAWDPSANRPVVALVTDGSTVYLGGGFLTVGGQPRICVAAVDAQTGEVTPWNPAAAGDGGVNALLLGDGVVYVGGGFNNIGGASRSRLAALDPVTGLATSWNPGANGTVHTLSMGLDKVLAGGEFTVAGGAARGRVAALDKLTGAATPWNPNASDLVLALAADGGTIYVGGYFTTIGGTSRNGLAAVDTTTGLATPWNANLGPALSWVDDLALNAGALYVGGSFSTIGGQPRTHLAALDVATGEATSWDAGPNMRVKTVQVSEASVCAGGNFTSFGGVTRNGLAALDATTGAATSWDPNVAGSVGLLVLRDGILYAGGTFETVGGLPRHLLAAVDAMTGAVTPWNPNPNYEIRALAVGEQAVYTAGYFDIIGGQSRNHIAALDPVTGDATAWNPNANALVEALAVSGGTVYAGGDFSKVGGQERHHLAALDAATGAATSWNPNASNLVRTILPSGGIVYVGGDFASVGGQSRARIAALGALTGAATPWDPHAVYPNGFPSVYALAVSGGLVCAGGFFDIIGGQPRHSVAALDPTTGLATAWDPHPDGYVRDFGQSGDTVYAAGSFWSICHQPHSWMAALSFEMPVSAGTSLDELPDRTRLSFQGSNPTRGAVDLLFDLAGAERRHVTIDVLDVMGRRVKSVLDSDLPGGRHSLAWKGNAEDGHDVGAGVYFVRLKTGSVTDVRKAVLVR